MTTSEPPGEAFVWTWLPGASDPVVAGRLEIVGDLVSFVYGRSYLARNVMPTLPTSAPSPTCSSPARIAPAHSTFRPRPRTTSAGRTAAPSSRT